MLSFEEARNLFPITKNHVYLAVAAKNPGATPVVSAIHQFFKDLQEESGSMDKWHEKANKTKVNIAKLIHCDPSEICLTKNTSEGLNIAAQGIPIARGENVILDDLENPNNIYPWINLKKHKGVEIRIVRSRNCRLELRDILSAVDRKTRAISISHVTPYYGFHNDMVRLGEICKEEDIYLVDDAIQAVGIMEIDVKKMGLDMLACGGHKGLLGSFGTGFLYVNRETCKEIAPAYLALSSVSEGKEFPFDGHIYTDARRFEIGNANYPGLCGLNEGLKILLDIGVKNIERHVFHLSGLLIEELQNEKMEINSSLIKKERSGIVSFNVRDPLRTMELLMEEGIIISVRKNAIRVSFHLYNNEGDVERFMHALKRGLK